MRTPAKVLPRRVARWSRLGHFLRWLDAGVASLVAWGVTALWLPDASPLASALAAAALVILAGSLPAVRVRWRPASAAVALSVSAGLRPGDHAWYVRSGEADLVLVTARRRVRVVIARPGTGAAEGLDVRRTRVLLVPADASARLAP